MKNPEPTVQPKFGRLRLHPPARLLAVLFFLVSCGEKEAPPEPKRFVYPLPQPRVATHVPEGLGEWLKLLEEMRRQIGSLEEKIAEHQQLHQATPFDEFLGLDPAALQKDQLSYLWHFADKGYFTVEREIIIKILESRRAGGNVPEAATNIADRAKNLASEYEQRLNDLQTASELYEKTRQGEFHVPGRLNDEQLDVLRGMVREKLATARAEVARLDARIAELQGPVSEPPGPKALAVESQKAIPEAPDAAAPESQPLPPPEADEKKSTAPQADSNSLSE